MAIKIAIISSKKTSARPLQFSFLPADQLAQISIGIDNPSTRYYHTHNENCIAIFFKEKFRLWRTKALQCQNKIPLTEDRARPGILRNFRPYVISDSSQIEETLKSLIPF